MKNAFAITTVLFLAACGGSSGGDNNPTVTPPPPNQPPVADAGSDRSEPERTRIDLDGSSSADPDGGITNYSWVQTSGTVVSIDAANQAVASIDTPEVDVAGEDIGFELTVTDAAGASSMDQVMISVSNVNLSPTANAGPDQTVYEGELFTIDAVASFDQDGAITSYNWQLLSGMAIDIPNPSQTQILFTAPATATVKENVFELTVTDELDGVGTDTVSVFIRPIIPPVANAGANQTVESESIVILSALGSTDSDGSIVSYQWRQVSGAAVILDDPSLAEPTFTGPLVSVTSILIQFEVTVVDDANATATDTVDITVTPPTHDVSGTVSVPDRNQIDGDVNDPAAPYVSNDTPTSAQLVPNPVRVGGYANRIFQGADGRSYAVGDTSDFYRVLLSAGQAVNIYLDAVSGDLDLYLWDVSATQLLDASLSVSGAETVIAPTDAEYVVEIFAYSGSANYVLELEDSAPISVPGGFSLHIDFVAGEAIVKYHETDSASEAGKLKPSLASALAVRNRGGSPSRAMLVSVDPDLEAASAAAGFTKDEFSHRATALADVELRNKFRTLLAIKMLTSDPAVRYAEPNYLIQSTAIPDDELYVQQWHYPLINLPDAWDQTMGDPSVIVAVIDTGVLLNHPDLQGQLIAGYDFISSTTMSNDGDGIDPDPDDPGDGCGNGASSFHGTHVAGTIGAATNNAIGVAGIAGGARLMPLRTLGCGGGSSYDIGQAVLYAAGLANDSGLLPTDAADIMNLSLGGYGSSQFSQDIYTAARNAGAIVVAAAGNDATSQPFFPSNYDGVISVSAIGITSVRSSYSNFGSKIDVAAPGGDFTADLDGNGFSDTVISTDGDDSADPIEFTYEYKAGTSMASPHVAGVLALMKSVNKSLTPADIDALLVRGDIVTEAGSLGWDIYYGWGIIDAAKSVTAAIDAVGNPPAVNPAMDVRPRALNFGVYTSDFTFAVSNLAGGSLVVGNITLDPAATWLSVAPDVIDGDGVGSYLASVDRSGLADGVYNTALSIESNANTVQMEATLIVGPPATTAGEAGHMYVVFVATTSGTTAFWAEILDDQGTLRYTVPAVFEGDYTVWAGSDFDNDFFICDSGEACGIYLDYASPTTVTVDADIVLPNFSVSYDWYLPSSASTGDRISKSEGVVRSSEEAE